jgi:hypothetical protein
MRRFVLAVVLAFAASFASAAEFSSLEERMTEQEFREAGLDTLSPEQLAKLNDWLRTRGAGTAAGGRTYGSSAEGFRPQGLLGDDVDRGLIISAIDGEFTGWTGKTRFTLQNGQVWEQVEPGSFAAGKLMNPGVAIEPAALGSWLLKIDGFNRSVRVSRIR